MDSHKKIYGMPNLGCMIGTAYQRLVSQLSEVLKESGIPITPPEYLVLRALYEKDGMQQCEIGDMIGKDKSAICRSVAGLVRKGIVTTEAVSHKCIRVWLTDAGKNYKGDIMSIAEHQHDTLVGVCTPEEFRIFSNVLRKIISQ
ncbi:MAG: MarR family winged helix-turn-helix transcriptional regulator [Duncaniella sp.]|nr:MarR family winged helix-turn-helix transcriptional regulator [Duncaniella sp.]